MPISTVNLNDTFDIWRIKTNQSIEYLNSLETSGLYLANTTGTFVGDLTFTGNVIFSTSNASSPALTHKHDLNTGLYFPANDNVAISTAGTERLRIDNQGRLGVGTSTPNAKIDIISTVAGSLSDGIVISNKSLVTDTEAGIFLSPSTTVGRGARISAIQEGTSDYISLKFYTGAGSSITEKQRIDANGNVGIGTQTPTSKLHVVGTANITSTLTVQGSNVILSIASANAWVNASVAGANAWTNTAVAGANAWVNTAVAGANAWSNTVFGYLNTSVVSANAWSNTKLSNTSGAIFNGTLYIAANLGIGTTSAAANLDVVGTYSFAKASVLSQTLTDGATITWNTSLGQVATVTLGGNRTMTAPTNLKIGTYILNVIQDGVGSKTITWNAVFKWPGGIAPVLTTTANARDVMSFFSDGTNLYGTYINDVK